MDFNAWIDTFFKEKGYDMEGTFEIKAPKSTFGNHSISYACVVECIKRRLPADIKAKIKDTLVKIDFQNGDALDYLRYIGKGMVDESGI